MTPASDSSSEVKRSPTLEDAWRRFGKYDRNATLAQKKFIYQRKLILILGVAATAFAVIYSILEGQLGATLPWLPANWQDPLEKHLLPFLHGLVVITPITLSILVAVSVKFNMGISWVMLRSSAEALKKEIFRYRMKVDEYSEVQTQSESRDVKLALKVKLISKRLMETQVNQTGLEPYIGDLPPQYGTATGDDGFSDMKPDDYVTHRIEDQFAYYQGKAVKLSHELQRFQWWIYILGGVGTLLAAFGYDVWIAVSSALATALTSFLEFKRVETNVVSCNVAAADLYDIRAWWRALPESARRNQQNIETLVSTTEGVILGENAGWVQEMRDSLAEIYGEKKKEEAPSTLPAQTESPSEEDIAAAPKLQLTETPDLQATDSFPEGEPEVQGSPA